VIARRRPGRAADRQLERAAGLYGRGASTVRAAAVLGVSVATAGQLAAQLQRRIDGRKAAAR